MRMKEAEDTINEARTELDRLKERVAELESVEKERDHARKRLRESDERYRSLFDNMMDAFGYHKIIVDDEGKPIDYLFLDVNTAFCKLTGLQLEDILNRRVTEVFPGIENNDPDLISIYGKVALSGEPIRFTLHFEPLKSWYSVLAYSPKKYYFVAIFENITEEKNAQEATAKVARFPSENPNPVLRIGRDGTILYANSSSRPLLDLWDCKEGECLSEEWHQISLDALKTGKPQWSEAACRDRVFSITYAPIPEFGYVNVYALDITQRKQAGKKLQEYSEKLEEMMEEREKDEEELSALYYRQNAILAAIPDIIMEVDKDKVYTFANNAGYEFFGNDVLGQSADHFFEGEQDTYQNVQPLFNGDENVIYVESWQRRKDGEKRLLAWWCRVLKDMEGNVMGALSSARDITDQKKAEEQIRASLKEKETLLKEIHHRVKNNLQIVSSLLDLQSDMVEDESLQNTFTAIQTRIKSMALVHETLYSSMDLAAINSRDYIQGIAEYLSSIYSQTGNRIPIEAEVDDINLDIDRAIPLGLIINELLSNALKYAFPDEHTGTISLDFKRFDTGDISLTISDDGVGIPPDVDVENPSALGLQLVNMLTEQIKGTLTITREDGTTFEIIIPA